MYKKNLAQPVTIKCFYKSKLYKFYRVSGLHMWCLKITGDFKGLWNWARICSQWFCAQKSHPFHVDYKVSISLIFVSCIWFHRHFVKCWVDCIDKTVAKSSQLTVTKINKFITNQLEFVGNKLIYVHHLHGGGTILNIHKHVKGDGVTIGQCHSCRKFKYKEGESWYYPVKSTNLNWK